MGRAGAPAAEKMGTASGCSIRQDREGAVSGLNLGPPNAEWMKQAARQLVDAVEGFALGKTHLIIDRDTKYCAGFRQILESAGVKIVFCPPWVPQCNAYSERFVRSIKEECLSRLVFFGEDHLRKTSRFSAAIIGIGAITKGSTTNSSSRQSLYPNSAASAATNNSVGCSTTITGRPREAPIYEVG